MFHSDSGGTACTRLYGVAARPLVCTKQRLPRKVFRSSIAWLSDSLSTLRSAGYPHTTPDSLPAASQALLDGISTRKVPLKGFKGVDYISSPFPKLCLAQMHRPPAAENRRSAQRSDPPPAFPVTEHCSQCDGADAALSGSPQAVLASKLVSASPSGRPQRAGPPSSPGR
jgi:hypothetical protein